MTDSTGHSHLHSALLVVIGFVVLACSATELRATVILPNVPAGTPYEILFVTLDNTLASSTDITTYNSFVSTEANLSPAIAALHLTWHAVASTAAVDAIVNAPDNGVAVYNTQGIELATAATGIYDGTILSPVQYNQFGNSESSDVWTGATSLGAMAQTLGMVPPEVNGFPTIGHSNSADGTWISLGSPLTDNSVQGGFPLYALSSPIPEPATIVLLASALLVIGGMRLVRWRALA